MTLNDVKNDVAALGFEREIELDASFLSAVNRALVQIFTEKKYEKVMRISPKAQRVAFYKKKIEHNPQKSESFKSVCRGFAFRSFGKGELTVSDDFGTKAYDFDGENVITRGFTKGEASFTFSGEFCYTVSDFTVYGDLISSSESDLVPLGDKIFFDPKKYDKDFLGFSSYPYDEYDNLIAGTVIDARGIGIKLPYSGIINVNYRIKPPVLNADSVNESINLPDGCEHLLPLLTAHYVWLDDDFAKAEHYLSLYRDGMSAVKYYGKDYTTLKYSTNGWA